MAVSIDIQDVVNAVLADYPGITKDDLARVAGVTGRQVQRWAAGESNPPARKIVEALEKLGIAPSDYGLWSSGTVRVETTRPPAWFQQFLETEWATSRRSVEKKLDRIIASDGSRGR